MTREDIIALARAGFSVEQIAAISQLPAAPAPAVPEQAPAVPAQAPAQAPAESWGEQIMQQLAGLTSAIQQSAIMQSNQPPEQTADDIIAAIIAPPQIGADNNK